MTPHKHAEIIKAWADGHKIQFRCAHNSTWQDVEGECTPSFAADEYRVKPQPKLVTQEYHVYLPAGHVPIFVPEYPANIRLIFEGEKLIDVELIGNE